MKKIITLLIILLLVLLSCNGFGEKEPLLEVNNDSDYAVSFTVMNQKWENETYTISPHQSNSYKDNSYKDIIIRERILSYSSAPKPWVSLNYISNSEVKFYNTAKITLNISNTLNMTAALSADGYMETEPLSIPANNTEAGFIYTSTPAFTVTTGSYPAVAEYNYDLSANIMYVTIR